MNQPKNPFVCTPKSFGKITKDHTCATLLGQLYYWALTEGEWFDRTQTEIFDLTAISARQQNTAREKLQEMGFIEVERRGIPARLFYKINFESIELAHEFLGFKLPEYKKNQNAQPSKSTHCTEKNLPTKANNRKRENAEVKEQSASITYSLETSIKSSPETLVVAQQVCAEMEAKEITCLPSADDPILLFTIECGATAKQFSNSADYAIRQGKGNFNYVLARVRLRMEEAVKLADKPKAAPKPSKPSTTHASHVETQPEAPTKPSERLNPARLNDSLAMLSKPRGL